MGVISIPSNPSSGGKLEINLDLNASELRILVDKLNNAARRLKTLRSEKASNARESSSNGQVALDKVYEPSAPSSVKLEAAQEVRQRSVSPQSHVPSSLTGNLQPPPLTLEKQTIASARSAPGASQNSQYPYVNAKHPALDSLPSTLDNHPVNIAHSKSFDTPQFPSSPGAIYGQAFAHTSFVPYPSFPHPQAAQQSMPMSSGSFSQPFPMPFTISSLPHAPPPSFLPAQAHMAPLGSMHNVYPMPNVPLPPPVTLPPAAAPAYPQSTPTPQAPGWHGSGPPSGPQTTAWPALGTPAQKTAPGRGMGAPTSPAPVPMAQQSSSWSAPPPRPGPSTQRSAPAPSRAAPAPNATSLLQWEACFASDGADHGNDLIQSLSYFPTLEGLPGGSGHGGWLISGSKNMLNLWECNAGGGRGIPPLMVMHSQMTEFVSLHISPDSAAGVLYASSVEVKKGLECVSVHSLSASNMLATKYSLRIPAPSTPLPAGPTPANKFQIGKIVSLHKMAAANRGSVVVAHGTRLLIFDAPAAGPPPNPTGGPPRPRIEWRPSDAPVTALAVSSYGQAGGAIFSGQANGAICMWSLRERTPAAYKKLAHGASVTGLAQTNDTLLISSGADGRILLWDLRRVASPLSAGTPDGSPITRLVPSPFGDCAAVSTTTGGLYAVDLLEQAPQPSIATITPASSAPAAATDIIWNAATSELYASGRRGVITVYRQRSPV